MDGPRGPRVRHGSREDDRRPRRGGRSEGGTTSRDRPSCASPTRRTPSLYLLLAFPAMAGALLGVPLVAGELDGRDKPAGLDPGDHPDAVVGHQVVRWSGSRSSCSAGSSPSSPSGGPTTSWRSGAGDGLFWNSLSPGNSRIDPQLFSTTGVTPIAYTLFAFALGTALGALLRRVSLAAIGTFVIYGIVALVMVSTIRPILAPQDVHPDPMAHREHCRLRDPDGAGNLVPRARVRVPARVPPIRPRPSADTARPPVRERAERGRRCFERYGIVPGEFVPAGFPLLGAAVAGGADLLGGRCPPALRRRSPRSGVGGRRSGATGRRAQVADGSR